jgi:hypothetical protein
MSESVSGYSDIDKVMAELTRCIEDGNTARFAELYTPLANLMYELSEMRNVTRTEPSAFEKWFTNAHPETIDSVTIKFK